MNNLISRNKYGITNYCSVNVNAFKNPNADRCFWDIVNCTIKAGITIGTAFIMAKIAIKKVKAIRDDQDARKRKTQEEKDNKPENRAKKEAQEVEIRVCEALELRKTRKPTESSIIDDVIIGEKPVFLVKNFLRQDERVIIYSGTGVGKTIFAMQIALALAMGRDIEFLEEGSTLSDPMNVILFDAEMENCDISDRFNGLKENLTPEKCELLKSNLKRLYDSHFPTMYHFIEELMCWADQIDRDTVFIIDNLTKIVTGTLTGALIQDYYNSLHAIQRRCAKRGVKLTFITVNHTTKDKEVMLGSANLANFATNVFQLSEVEGDDMLRRINSEKRRWGKKESLLVKLTNVPYTHFELVQEDSKPSSTNDDGAQKKHSGGRPPMTKEQVEMMHELHKEGKTNSEIAKIVNVSEMTVSRKLKKADIRA